MTQLAFFNGAIATPAGWVTDKALLVNSGKIAGFVDVASIPSGATRIDP